MDGRGTYLTVNYLPTGIPSSKKNMKKRDSKLRDLKSKVEWLQCDLQLDKV